MASPGGPNPNPKRQPQPSTTFVKADASNFRAVVQKLTGDTTHKVQNSIPSTHAGKPILTEVGRRKSGYKLHERRKTAKKLEITLSHVSHPFMSQAARERSVIGYGGGGGGDCEMVVASPVSTLAVCGRGSPGTPMEELEEKAIAEKGFYLHPSPIREPEPELLVLFPLNSPKSDPYS